MDCGVFGLRGESRPQAGFVFLLHHKNQLRPRNVFGIDGAARVGAGACGADGMVRRFAIERFACGGAPLVARADEEEVHGGGQYQLRN